MKYIASLLWCFLLSTSTVYAELNIRITKGVDNPTVISVVPFNSTGGALPENVAQVISDDLRRSGQFEAIAPENMLSYPSSPQDVVYRDWRLLGSEYLVIGNIIPATAGYQLTYSLFDVISQKSVLSNQVVEVGQAGLRDMAHHVSDRIYEAITGIRGAFSTDIIYVEQRKTTGQYRLVRADVDGARPQVLLKSSEPLLSPVWSPNGRSVAYVSFETGRPAIFMQDLSSGKREQLTNFKGLNSAPAWSPDGKKLALVLSKDGNPEIYILDLASRRFKRITKHFGIDTEPTWTKDGQNLLSTSNRGGKPQIYQVPVSGGYPQRLTFEGDYNARARVTPDGKHVVMVHRRNGIFHIATQSLETGEVRVLTETTLDESPSVAPNGASLIYATKLAGKGILASVSMDAGTRFALPSTSGDVREPTWSPYFE